MLCIRTKKEMLGKNIPEEIIPDALQTIEQIELLNKEDSTSHIAIITNKTELDTITKQVQYASPEIDEFILNTSWRKRVYIIDDYGNGVVIYDNVSGAQ